MTDLNNNEDELNKENKKNELTDSSNNKTDKISESNSSDSHTTIKNKERKLHERRCPYCKQDYKTTIGADNWKNLFRKPTIDDWIVLIILVLIIGAAYAYSIDTQTCRDTLKNIDAICLQRRTAYTTNISGSSLNLPINITNVNPGVNPTPNPGPTESNASEVNSSDDSNLTTTPSPATLPAPVINYSNNSTQSQNLTNVSG